MCGRFTLTSTPEELARRFELDAAPEVSPRYNVAPGQEVLAVRAEAGARRAARLRWGLVPAWASDPAIGSRTINARIETVRERPAFRDALAARRCLIPANGFYEWADRAGRRAPYHLAAPGDALLAFAGLWARWRDPADGELESCTILTTDAHPAIRELHDRMPVIVAPATHADWLDPGRPADAALLARLREEAGEAAATLRFHPVDPRVNHPGFDDPRCVERVPEPPRQESLF